jgi:hypothetical protein
MTNRRGSCGDGSMDGCSVCDPAMFVVLLPHSGDPTIPRKQRQALLPRPRPGDRSVMQRRQTKSDGRLMCLCTGGNGMTPIDIPVETQMLSSSDSKWHTHAGAEGRASCCHGVGSHRALTACSLAPASGFEQVVERCRTSGPRQPLTTCSPSCLKRLTHT